MCTDDDYDYSGIPDFENLWEYQNEYDTMEVKVTPVGLTYVGYDAYSLSGGYYTAGFQSYDEFLEDGPIKEMPKDIEEALRRHIHNHRKIGGTRLSIIHINNTPLKLWRAFVSIDERSVVMGGDEEKNSAKQVVIFNGPVKKGEHMISYVLQYKEQKDRDNFYSVKGKETIVVGENKSEIIFTAGVDDSGKILVTISKKQDK